VRTALLDALAPQLANSRVLDLFAGTGALGLEAISRGATSADFVEFRPASLHALRANIAALRLKERTRVFKREAMGYAAALRPDAYDITFADPPYEFRVLERLLALWRELRFARILALEHARGYRLPAGFHHQSFKESAVTIYQL
jgi:16S rRNA (guanine966-N2)-methyltransferase